MFLFRGAKLNSLPLAQGVAQGALPELSFLDSKNPSKPHVTSSLQCSHLSGVSTAGNRHELHPPLNIAVLTKHGENNPYHRDDRLLGGPEIGFLIKGLFDELYHQVGWHFLSKSAMKREGECLHGSCDVPGARSDLRVHILQRVTNSLPPQFYDFEEHAFLNSSTFMPHT